MLSTGSARSLQNHHDPRGQTRTASRLPPYANTFFTPPIPSLLPRDVSLGWMSNNHSLLSLFFTLGSSIFILLSVVLHCITNGNNNIAIILLRHTHRSPRFVQPCIQYLGLLYSCNIVPPSRSIVKIRNTSLALLSPARLACKFRRDSWCVF